MGYFESDALETVSYTHLYPMTLLQDHEDAIITATYETANHPISRHPEWKFSGVNI